MPEPPHPQNDRQYTAVVVPIEPLDDESLELIDELLVYFNTITNEMIRRLLKGEKFNYKEYKGDFHTKVSQRAEKIAIELVTAYKKLCGLFRKRLIPCKPSEPTVNKLFARLAKEQIKFRLNNELLLRISVKPRKFAYFKVHVTKQLKPFIPLLLDLEKNRSMIGEPTIFYRGKRLFLSIPIRVLKGPVVEAPDALISIDYNENSIDLLLIAGNTAAIIRLFTYLKVLREKYAEIRRGLQKKYGKSNPNTKHGRKLRRLLSKYGSREAMRIKEITRYAIHTIIGLAWLTGAKLVRESLKHLKDIPGKGLLSYRLSSLPYTTFRNMLDTKSTQHGVRLIVLSEDETMNTSRECPKCGRIATRINSEYAKCKCGCEFNPQISALFIIAKRKSLLRIIKWPKKLEYNEKQVIIRIPMKRLANASIEEATKNPIKYYRFIRITIKELKNPITIQLAQSGTQVRIKKMLEVDVRKTLWLAPLRLATILLELAK